MLLGIAGVTGIGKSYYKDLLVKELNFEKVRIITTREIRKGEKNNEDKVFLTEVQLQKLREEGKIAYEFKLAGNTYAYTKEELFSNNNMVCELHYATLTDFKRICPNLKTLYLLPRNIQDPISKLKERNLKPEAEYARRIELEEHYHKIMTDEGLKTKFDYMMQNDYNKETDEKVINLIKAIME